MSFKSSGKNGRVKKKKEVFITGKRTGQICSIFVCKSLNEWYCYAFTCFRPNS